MHIQFKFLLITAAMSACFVHAAETLDPLGVLPGEVEVEVEQSAPVVTKPAQPEIIDEPAVHTPAFDVESTEKAPNTSFAAKPASPVAPPSASTPSPAVSPPAPVLERTFTRTSNATFLQMDQLRSSNAILAEQVRQKELMDKLNPPAQAQAGSATPTFNQIGHNTNAPGPVAANIQPNMVLSIYGIEDDLTAVISTASVPLKVKVGGIVPGVGLVKAITREGVTVTTKKSTRTLEMAPISAYPGVR